MQFTPKCTSNHIPKEKKHFNYSYLFVDFEADITEQCHKAYMRCLKNEDDSITLTFSGEDWADKLLKFRSSKYLFYFYNLGFQSMCTAKYGAT